MEGEQEHECWTRTREDEEVIHCPLVVWIQMTSSLVVSSATEVGAGEAGCEEIQRARGMAGGELWIPVCPW